MHLSRLVSSCTWWPRLSGLGMHRHAHGLDPYLGVYGLIAGALTRAQGGWACTSARTSPTSLCFVDFVEFAPPGGCRPLGCSRPGGSHN